MQFARGWLVTARDVRYVDVIDVREVLTQILDDVSLCNLLVIDIEQHTQRRTVDVVDEVVGRLGLFEEVPLVLDSLVERLE